jgi:glycosyltransferase involved in cell wall biosynthesis
MRVDITIPVLNEEQGLEDGVGTLRRFIESTYGSMDGFAIVIADNGSDDRTPEIARRLADQFSFVRHVRLAWAGR